MEVSTTNPAPPTGITPTEVPLGITTATTVTQGPVNIPRTPATSLSLNRPIYIDKFTITPSNVTGQQVYAMTTKFPFGDFPNRYNQNAQEDDTIQFFVPWSLIKAFYSKQCKIDWEMELVPVKVADSRVILDVVFGYDDGQAPPSTQLLYLANDTVSFKLDSQNEPIKIMIPQFWATEVVQTDTFRARQVTAPLFANVIQPAFLPTTNVVIRIRNPYQPNLIQPDTFEVLVFLRPIVTTALAIGGKSSVVNRLPDIETHIPVPYFLNKSTI
jgi:hypothetical protein